MPGQKLYDSFKISTLMALKHTVGVDEHDQLKLDKWLSEDKLNRELYAKITDDTLRKNALKEINAFDVKAAKEIVLTKIAAERGSPKSPFPYNWLRIVAAASIAVTICAAVWFYTAGGKNLFRNDQSKYAGRQDVAPGRNIATLKIGDGKPMQLKDNKAGVVIARSAITYTDGSPVRSVPGEILSIGHTEDITITTPRGGTYQVRLPDGTQVWLNAASSLTYNVDLSRSQKVRKVVLNGEAYFEVFKDRQRPFHVSTRGQEIQVLGTHFNINSYSDEPAARTTLLEGSVRLVPLTHMTGKQEEKMSGYAVTIKPGEQAIAKEGRFNVIKTNPLTAVDWKNKKLIFDKENIESIMRKISRWYNVDVVYEGTPRPELFVGEISRYENVSKVLRMLELTGSVNFKLEGRRIIVLK